MTVYNSYIQYFKDKHIERIGHPYDVQWGKDNKIMNGLCQIYGFKKLTLMIDQFFEDFFKDEFLQRTGATIGIFKTQVPKLLLKIKDGKKEFRGKW